MPAYTRREPGLAVKLHRAGLAPDRRHAADGHQAIVLALAMIAALPELGPGDQLVVDHFDSPEPDLPAVSRASHYS